MYVCVNIACERITVWGKSNVTTFDTETGGISMAIATYNLRC